MAVKASLDLRIRGIICDSASGRTARYLSAFRGDRLIFCECYNDSIVRKLAISYGVYSVYSNKGKMGNDFVEVSLKELLKREDFSKEDLVVVLAGRFGKDHGASFVEISSVRNLLGNIITDELVA